MIKVIFLLLSFSLFGQRNPAFDRLQLEMTAIHGVDKEKILNLYQDKKDLLRSDILTLLNKTEHFYPGYTDKTYGAIVSNLLMVKNLARNKFEDLSDKEVSEYKLLISKNQGSDQLTGVLGAIAESQTPKGFELIVSVLSKTQNSADLLTGLYLLDNHLDEGNESSGINKFSQYEWTKRKSLAGKKLQNAYRNFDFERNYISKKVFKTRIKSLIQAQERKPDSISSETMKVLMKKSLKTPKSEVFSQIKKKKSQEREIQSEKVEAKESLSLYYLILLLALFLSIVFFFKKKSNS